MMLATEDHVRIASPRRQCRVKCCGVFSADEILLA